MQHLSFAALAGSLFVFSYGGVAWTMAGAPLPSLSSLSFSKPEVRYASLPRPQSPVVEHQSRQADSYQSSQGDGHPERDKLRRAALQASTSYALSPCDDAAKASMIEAVSSYAKAWHDMMGCGPNGCDYKKLNATAATFSTPLDLQVRDALGAAFDKYGISVEDFPSSLRINVAMMVRGRGAPATACPETRVQVIR
jgi:hypothetical protein